MKSLNLRTFLSKARWERYLPVDVALARGGHHQVVEAQGHLDDAIPEVQLLYGIVQHVAHLDLLAAGHCCLVVLPLQSSAQTHTGFSLPDICTHTHTRFSLPVVGTHTHWLFSPCCLHTHTHTHTLAFLFFFSLLPPWTDTHPCAHFSMMLAKMTWLFPQAPATCVPSLAQARLKMLPVLGFSRA